MPEVRKLVTSSLYTLLSSSSTGFNQQYAAALATNVYPSAEPIEIDWTPGIKGANNVDPKQFFIGELDEIQIDSSQLLTYPACNLYTLEIDGGASNSREKHRKFSGIVTVGLKWFLKHRDGIEQDDVEDTVGAIDDAVLEILYLIGGGTFPGINYNGDYKSGPARHELIGNGWRTTFPSTILFEVNV
jgi:hypothetical protein